MHTPTNASERYQKKLLASNKYVKLFIGNEWEEGIYLNRKAEIPTHTQSYTFSPFRGGTESFDETVGGDLPFGYHYNIDYYFIGNHLPHNGYGSTVMNDQLYYILVNRFNGGEDFVQVFLDEYAPSLIAMNTYLDPITNIIETNEMYKDKVGTLQEYNNTLDDISSILTENEVDISVTKSLVDIYGSSYEGYDTSMLKYKSDGSLDMRYKENKTYLETESNYHTALDRLEQLKKAHRKYKTRKTKITKITNDIAQDVESLSEMINDGGYSINGKTWVQNTKKLQTELRENFIACMRNGTLSPVALSKNTEKKRIRAGLPPDPAFFASGNFAESIRFIVKIQ